MKNISLLLVFLLSCLWFQASAQNRTISGRVTEGPRGDGLPGVTVLAKGTTIGATTDVQGAYSLSVPATVTTLTFSSVGYTAVDRTITGQSVVNVSLATSAVSVGEVVVVAALGVGRQSQTLGYAATTLNTAEITQARPTNAINGLTGKVSGLQVQTLSNGVNPEVRVTLRGNRSITGTNQALVVVDGIISTNQVLAALNPDDIATQTVLKGATAAALYGSQASNGALIITTRKGGTRPQVTLSQTSQFESISFLPKFQNEFGPGSPNTILQRLRKFDPLNQPDQGYASLYQGFENQQFGPRFDGSLRPLGEPLADGSVQYIPYVARPEEKLKFFNTAYQAQNGISFSGGDDKSKFYASYQNVHNNGIVPKDQFDRNSFRFNASRELGRLTAGFNISYSQQKTDITSNLSNDQNNSVYFNIFNTSVLVPITDYKDWQNNPFANPNGYYNAYYFNPYFVIDNNRTVDRRNAVTGNVDLSYRVKDWLRFQYRLGTTNLDQSSLTTQDKFNYNAYVAGVNGAPGQTNKAGTPVSGFVTDLASNLSRINSDLFATFDKTFGILNVQAIVGNNVQQVRARFNQVGSSALAAPGLFNLGNRIGNLTGSDATATSRIYAFYADVTLGLKDYLFVHGSGRYDNVSVLESDNRSFFYPSVDGSFVFTNAIPALKDASFIDYGKIRGGISRTSQVNLPNITGPGVYESNGSYSLRPVFGAGAGFPFGTLPSFTAGNTQVQPALRPETTTSVEAGIELSFFKRRLAGGVTYYQQRSVDQTINTSISTATGYSGFRLNAGEVRNTGFEADVTIVPVRLDNSLTITLGGNFNYNNNEVISLPPGIDALPLSSGGNANVFAVKGSAFPVLQGSYYERVTVNGQELVKMAAQPVDLIGNVRYLPVKAADTKTFGNTQPKYNVGMNASIAYKGFVLSGQGEMRTGYVVYHSIGETMDFAGSSQRTADYGRLDFIFPNSAIPQTDQNGNVTYVANTTGLTAGNGGSGGSGGFWDNNANTSVAENYVTSGMFFKIREIALSYSLPTSMLAKSSVIKGVSLNLFARNIFTYVPKSNQWTDPEFNFASANSNAVGINSFYQTPPTKFVGANLSVTF